MYNCFIIIKYDKKNLKVLVHPLLYNMLRGFWASPGSGPVEANSNPN